MNTPNTDDKDYEYKNPNVRICDGCSKEVTMYTELKEFNVCKPCMDKFDGIIANRTVLGHLIDMLKYIFNFNFFLAVGSVLLIIQRVFKIGVYNPETGEFYTRKLIKKPNK